MPVTGARIATRVECTACGISSAAESVHCVECGTALPKPVFSPAPAPAPKPKPSIAPKTPKIVKEFLLGYTSGTSDKQYLLTMKQEGSEFVVIGQWGKRNRLRESMEKYRGPSSASANAAFDKVFAEKTDKGYKVERVTR